MIFWAIRDFDTDEMLAIYEERFGTQLVMPDFSVPIGHTDWYWTSITQAEFDTYRAFGFNELTVGETTPIMYNT